MHEVSFLLLKMGVCQSTLSAIMRNRFTSSHSQPMNTSQDTSLDLRLPSAYHTALTRIPTLSPHP